MMNERDLILAAIWTWFPPRRWAVCDNVYWGFGLHYEADAIAVSKSGIVHELEAKSVKSDLLRDERKRKWTQLAQSDYHWYVVPTKLHDLAAGVAGARGSGLIVVSDIEDGDVVGNADKILRPKLRRDWEQEPDKVRNRRNRIWRLAGIRYWEERIRKLQAIKQALGGGG